MNSGHPGNWRLQLQEAHIQGQIKAIEHALGQDPGGWPHDAWFTFVDARSAAVLSLARTGMSIDDIIETLNLNEVQTRLLIKLAEPDTSKN